MKYILLIFLSGFLAFSNEIIVGKEIRFPMDSVDREFLLYDLSNFLNNANSNKDISKYLQKGEELETKLLADELLNANHRKSNNDSNFYKPYLNNVLKLDSNEYLLTLSLLGIISDTIEIKIIFDLNAKKVDNNYKFSSRLNTNTKDWKQVNKSNHTFYFKDSINKEKLNKYMGFIEDFDNKLAIKDFNTSIYCCEDFTEAQKIMGLNYKLDYNGYNSAIPNTKTKNRKIILLGNNNAHLDNFDPHDLWHSRASLIKPRREYYRPIDEGCAYLYGGSWGYTWEEILQTFKDSIATNKQIDWLSIKEKPVYFKTGKFSNSADYIVNGIIIQKIEDKHGFNGVKKLLDCDPKGENYFAILNELIGINEDNYNDKIWELIN
jgi:hypothetical protein